MLRLTSVRDRDRGAIAMIVAMLFGFGVMIGLAALTIDVGNINANRRQLQNGADAVALAAVKVCVETGVCPNASNADLQALENANANPNAVAGVTGIRRVDGGIAICGYGGGLPACPPLSAPNTGNLQECPAPTPALPADTNYLRVYTQTTSTQGVHLLPYSFGAAIAGVGSGANQQTCASVTWGQPSGAAAPITLSYCEWAKATGNDPAHPMTDGGGTFPSGPVGSWPGYVAGISTAVPPVPTWPGWAAPLPAVPVPGNEIIIGLQGTASSHDCSTWNGHDGPGGFGYLNASACAATAALNGWIQVDTGNTMPSGCDLSPYFNKVIYLPVFDCMTTNVGGSPTWTPVPGTTCTTGGNGSNTWYHITGYAKFYLSGYKTGGGSSTEAGRTNPLATPSVPCTGNDRCLSGWFLRGLVNTPPAPPPPPGAPPLGAYTIQLSG